MLTQEDLDANPEIHERLLDLLKARLEKGKMTPFYKINMKMRNWMRKNKIEEVCRETYGNRYWHPQQISRLDGYLGLVFRAEYREIGCRRRGVLFDKVLRPSFFYLELPADLCEKVLILGEFP